LSFEQLCHEGAQRLRADKDQSEEDRDLQNSNASHNFPLELLRTEKRVDQVNKQPQRRDPGNDIVHDSFLLQLVAGPSEGPADKQKQASNRDVKQIKHMRLLRFLEQDFVTSFSQLMGQTGFPRRPPSLRSSNDDDRTGPQCAHDGFQLVPA